LIQLKQIKNNIYFMPEEVSPDYPIGQMVEPYDIWRDEQED
jgi:hypothetical protein